MVETFYVILRDEIKKHIPHKTITVRQRDKLGMTNEVRKMMNKGRYLNRIAKKSGLMSDILVHKEARKFV